MSTFVAYVRLRIIVTAEENLENKVVRQNEEREPVESSKPGTSGSFAKKGDGHRRVTR